MAEDFRSYALRGLSDAVEDALQSDCTPEEIMDCFTYAKEVFDLFYKIDRSQKVVNLNADTIESKKNWVDYTEMPDEFQYDMTDEELIKEGFKMRTEDGTIIWTKNTTEN